MRRGLLLITVAMLAANLPAVAAQEPSPADNTFYGHVNCDTSVFGISIIASSTGTNCGTGTPGTSQTWTLPEDPPLTVDLVLEEGADVPMWVWVGSTTHAGRVTVTSTVYSGDTVVAQAEGTAQYAGLVTSYVEVAMTGTALVSQVTEPLRWVVEASGSYSSIFMRFEEGRWSRFQLPIAGVLGGAQVEDNPAPMIQYENLTGAPDLLLAYSNVTSETRVYNWTQADGSGELAYNFTGNGTLNVAVVDGNGSLVLSELLEGTGLLPFSGMAPGNWSMSVDLQNVTGSVQLKIQGMTIVDPGVETPADGNATNGNATVEEESPGFEIVALVALLGAVAAMARRRR